MTWSLYLRNAGIILTVLVFILLGVWINVLHAQREAARNSLAKAELTLQGYRLAAEAQARDLHNAEAESERLGRKTQDLIADIGRIPPTDAEARRWAVEVAARLRR